MSESASDDAIDDANDDATAAEHAWLEALAIVQSTQDAEIHEEARDLVVAEMAAVTLGDRIGALPPGASIDVILDTTGDVDRIAIGVVESSAPDYLLVGDAHRRLLIPVHAIVAVTPLPQVVHPEQGPRVRGTWRSVLRDHVGSAVLIAARSDRTFSGSLTWVGRDHLSVRAGLAGEPAHSEVSIPWTAVATVALPPPLSSV